MTIYNGEYFLYDAIASILDQTFTDFEFLLIDDASSDNSHDIIQSFNDARIRYVKNNKNVGQTASLNYGLNLSKGKYIARMDQDDLSHRDRLFIQHNYMEQNPNISVVGSWAELINENGDYIGTTIHPTKYSDIKESIAFGCPISHSSAFFRKKIIDEIGGYPKDIVVPMDWGLWIICVQNDYKLSNIPNFLISLRFHQHNVSSSKQMRIRKEIENCNLFDLVGSLNIKTTTRNYSNGLRIFTCLKLCILLIKEKNMREAFQVFKKIIHNNSVDLFIAIIVKLRKRLNYQSKKYSKIEPAIIKHIK